MIRRTTLRNPAAFAPETPVPLREQLNRSLLQHQHFYAIALAMREKAVATGARLFFFSHNLHIDGNSREFAVRTATETICTIAHRFWWRGGGQGSFLSARANGRRPLLTCVPELDTWGSWHTHGFLLVPPSITQAKEKLHEALRELPKHVRLETGTKLRSDAVHLEFINSWETLESYSDYATSNWFGLPPADRCIDFSPHGKNVREDWNPIMRRAAELMSEQQLAVLHAEHRRAVRTDMSLKEGHEQRIETAKRIASIRESTRNRPYREVKIPVKPSSRLQLPKDGAPTGFIDC